MRIKTRTHTHTHGRILCQKRGNSSVKIEEKYRESEKFLKKV